MKALVCTFNHEKDLVGAFSVIIQLHVIFGVRELIHTRCPQAGCYTPESSVEHPEAVATLAEEFSRAGADITQVTGLGTVRVLRHPF